MRIVSMINYKGGVGKTTLTQNLAAYMASACGERVLLIDLDPQASLTLSCVDHGIWEQNLAPNLTIKKWYEQFILYDNEFPLNDLIYPLPNYRWPNNAAYVDLIPSHFSGLTHIETDISPKLAGVNTPQLDTYYVRTLSRLRAALSDPEITNKYTIVLIDCPPSFGITTKTAMVASAGYFIPTKPDHLSTLGVDQLRANVDTFTTVFNATVGRVPNVGSIIAPRCIGVIFNMCKPYNQPAIQDQRRFIANLMQSLATDHVTVLESLPQESNRFYSRDMTEGSGLPLVLRDEFLSEADFSDIQRQLQDFAREVHGLILTL